MTILVADDEPSIRHLIDTHLEQSGFEVLLASEGRSAIACWSPEVSVALIDLRMPGVNGKAVLKWGRREHPTVPIIMMSAVSDIRTAVECMRDGAHDFLVKPFDLGELTAKVRRAGEIHSLTQRYERLSSPDSTPSDIFSEDTPVPISAAQLSQRLMAVASVDSTVLLLGESGTGKSTAAREIHRLSRRKSGPFVIANCPGFPRDLLESELFGHERGAFTGATKRRLGLVETAEGGTLFLDEIADLPMSLQPKLLTFLQERRFQRLGNSQPLSANVRVIAATNIDLESRVAEKLFREDLYYRLNVIPVTIPPLRERADLLSPLATHILNRIAKDRNTGKVKISESAWTRMRQYHWPGNIRELENSLEQASLFCTNNIIVPSDLPFGRTATKAPTQPNLAGLTLRQIEELSLRQTLATTHNNKALAARLLDVSEKTVYNMLARMPHLKEKEQ